MGFCLYNQCYVGSSCQDYKKKIYKTHRNSYTIDTKRKIVIMFPCMIYLMNIGIENCKIVWKNTYACNSTKKKLEKREGQIQRENDCINKRVAGRTPDKE